MSTETIILGAGPAGLAAACELHRRGRRVRVIERAPRVGGLSASIEHEGCRLDLGPHFFERGIPEVDRMWDELLGDDITLIDRRTSMFWRGHRFAYPPSPLAILAALGPIETARITASALAARTRRGPPANYRDRLERTFGRRLVDSCFAPYIEKLWGVPCEAIDADWEAGRLRGTSVWSILAKIVGRRGDASFHHPARGAGQLYERAAAHLAGAGVRIDLEHDVEALHHDGKRVVTIQVRDRTTDTVTNQPIEGMILSSLPLPVLLGALRPTIAAEATAHRLAFRSTVIAYVFVDGDVSMSEQCLYVNDPSLRAGRVTNFANWGRDMRGDASVTPLCVEYWCDEDSWPWRTDEPEIRDAAIADVSALGLAEPTDVRNVVVLKLPRTHPRYDRNTSAILDDILAALSPLANIVPVGRAGAFRYHDQDRTLLQGIDAARRVCESGEDEDTPAKVGP